MVGLYWTGGGGYNGRAISTNQTGFNYSRSPKTNQIKCFRKALKNSTAHFPGINVFEKFS